jgi:dTDP-4-dehydrorhamnose 3,5-epimerase
VPKSEALTTPIAGLLLLQRYRIDDARGFLSRIYSVDDFDALLAKPIAQINHSVTRRKGAVRGMHFQLPPHAEIKMVSCLRGEVYDVALDLRKNSPTFLGWHAEVLSPGNQRSLLIPEGCAHGFQALTEDCELLYLHTATYMPGFESAVNAADPVVGIKWPLEITEMSERDRGIPRLTPAFDGIDVGRATAQGA